MNEVWLWLETSAVAEALRTSAWGYATAEALHLTGIVLLVGPAIVFDLRLLGLGKSRVSLSAATMLLQVAPVGATVAVWTGLLLFITSARQMASNPMFLLKLCLLLLAVINVVAFRLRVRRDRAERGKLGKVRLWPFALVSMTAWVGAIVAGRFIAYV